jgi:hypothetical protein
MLLARALLLKSAKKGGIKNRKNKVPHGSLAVDGTVDGNVNVAVDGKRRFIGTLTSTALGRSSGKPLYVATCYALPTAGVELCPGTRPAHFE